MKVKVLTQYKVRSGGLMLAQFADLEDAVLFVKNVHNKYIGELTISYKNKTIFEASNYELDNFNWDDVQEVAFDLLGVVRELHRKEQAIFAELQEQAAAYTAGLVK